MYILEPVLHETIWGGSKLCQFANGKGEKVGHLYMVNGHDQMSNRILNGESAGKTLRDVFQIKKDNWNMSEFKEFPLTIALVDAAENLSIQVHPDDLCAEQIEGVKWGKAESWFFLNAPVEGWIYGGCRYHAKDQVINAVVEKRMEEVTERVKISKDDYAYIEAGTLHAMTAGSLAYEIEYGSDITYRFFDYGRTASDGSCRELHIEKAIKALKPESSPRIRHNVGKNCISEEWYEICFLTNVSSYRNEGCELECLSVLEGYGKVEDNEIHSGMGIILLPGEKIELYLNRAIVSRINHGLRKKNEKSN